MPVNVLFCTLIIKTKRALLEPNKKKCQEGIDL